MRIFHRSAVGSSAAPVALAAMIVGAVSSAAGASPSAAPGPAGPPGTIVVDSAGGGDVFTIAEGVAMARDGDTVLVLAGT